MAVTLRIKNVDAFVQQFKLDMGARPSVRMGLVITGPAAAYALIWEWGRADIQPGPKTLWGTNPDGETTVLTRTAPFGYIRVNRNRYRQIIREELLKISWSQTKLKNLPAKAEIALRASASRIADLIAETAPFDTGQLREAILAVSITEADQQITDSLSVRARLRR